MANRNWAGPYGSISPRRRNLVWEVRYGNGQFTNIETGGDTDGMYEGEPFQVSCTLAARLRFEDGDPAHNTWIDVPPGVYSGRVPESFDPGTQWKQIWMEDIAGTGQTGWATLVFPLRDQ